MRIVRDEKPLILIGSPVCHLYCERLENGRYFLHEHPEWATSWSLEPITKTMAMSEWPKFAVTKPTIAGLASCETTATTARLAPTGPLPSSANLME